MAEILIPKKREGLAGKSAKEAYDALCAEGVVLSEDQLDMTAGGGQDDDWGIVPCPECGRLAYVYDPKTDYTCVRCGKEFHVKW